MTVVRTTDQLTPLGRTGWTLWNDMALRGAGFPADRFLELCDDELADAADQVTANDRIAQSRYDEVFSDAVDRLGKVMSRMAGESAFREAVTWQNPALVSLCLDYALQRRPRNSRGRQVEHTMASYLQRYHLKNDSIGFFGPIGWARLVADDSGVTAVPGPEMLVRRTTYFENWAIDGIAEHVAADPQAWAWLRPRLERSAALNGRVLRQPFQRPLTLTTAEVRLVRLCDGTRSVRDLVGEPPDPATTARLVDLVERGVLHTAVTGPLVLRPEQVLADWIDTIGDPATRARARLPLDAMVEARAAVAAAAGHPDRLLTAVTELAETFERITGHTSTRRAGRAYAGRTLVYEDTVRDIDVRIGRRVTDGLAPALGLILDSAGWLADAIGAQYERMARDLLDREQARTGSAELPMLKVLTALMPELGGDGVRGIGSDVVDAVRADFQQRWSRALRLPVPDGASAIQPHTVAADDVRAEFAREFPPAPPTWSGARRHAPDVMLLADDDAALSRGDVDFVLGELHCGCNTLENQLFVGQHPHPDRLRAYTVASRLDRRMIMIPRRDSEQASSRMSRATELMLPDHTYLSLGSESFEPPEGAEVLPVSALVVRRVGADLVVEHGGAEDGARYPFLEAVGEPLAAFCTDAFQPLPRGRHHPRITIDRLVVSRERWSFPATDVAWAFCADERRRYALARRWRADQGLPERGFVTVPVERKPTHVDFRSLPLVNMLAKAVRRTAEGSGEGSGEGMLGFTEMLPDLDRLWLSDAGGERYTAELRMIAVRAGGQSA